MLSSKKFSTFAFVVLIIYPTFNSTLGLFQTFLAKRPTLYNETFLWKPFVDIMTRPIFCCVNEFMFFFIAREMTFSVIEGAADNIAPPYLSTEKLTCSAPFVFSTCMYIENYCVKLNKLLNYFTINTSKSCEIWNVVEEFGEINKMQT